MAQNCSEGEAVELMTQTAPWGIKRADDPIVPRRGGNRADDPNCRELTLEYPVSGATCRGPAPADPGYSKERRLGEGRGTTA